MFDYIKLNHKVETNTQTQQKEQRLTSKFKIQISYVAENLCSDDL